MLVIKLFLFENYTREPTEPTPCVIMIGIIRRRNRHQ